MWVNQFNAYTHLLVKLYVRAVCQLVNASSNEQLVLSEVDCGKKMFFTEDVDNHFSIYLLNTHHLVVCVVIVYYPGREIPCVEGF